ncbi:hypothetical protein PGTUg99_015017 [Puccinia graminis f. sp. tritici]|uniref:Uncharacterized protein n=1 Tax=Puccinia graminis f. sp. tritici TaxID=56615 RepID=A0A5B0Q0U2_PUCGR|nr:hypothetical protein PGTUg99_015017 [Puccinia graminis f. sp. tritici]
MAPNRKYQVPVKGDRTTRLRRAANGPYNAQALQRLRASQRDAARGDTARREEDAFQQEDILQQPPDHMYDDAPPNQDEQQGNSAEVEEDTECAWVTLDEEIPNPIDQVIQSRIEQHRRDARNFNLASVIRALHPTYMALKHRTQNWTGPEAAHSFVNCRCAPHTVTKRMVDMIDIMGEPFNQLFLE